MHARVLVVIGIGIVATQGAALADDAAGSQVARSLAATCAACHGTDGSSDVPGTRELAGLERDFILARLKAFREPASKGETMQHLANGYTPEQEAMVAAYFSSLGKGKQ